jgi:hypothetical protein
MLRRRLAGRQGRKGPHGHGRWSPLALAEADRHSDDMDFVEAISDLGHHE